MNYKKLLASLSVLAVLFSGCGGGSEVKSSKNTVVSSETHTGYFIDSNVSGLSYSSESINGITGSDGSFEFKDGENTTFKIGNMVIGQVKASSIKKNNSIVTPFLLYPNNENMQNNLAKILLSLDKTPKLARTISLDSNLSFNTEQFDLDDNTSVEAFVNYLSENNLLEANVSIEDAIAHLEQTKSTLDGTSTLKKVSGKVIDGYVKDARLNIVSTLYSLRKPIFVDGKNISENIVTDENGSYSTFISSDGGAISISAQGGVDTSTGEEFQGKLKGIVTGDDNTSNITPLTTLVSNVAESNSSESDISQIQQNIANSLGLDSSDIESDPISMLNTDPDKGAQILKKALMVQKTVEGFISSLDDPNANDSAYGVIGDKLNEAQTNSNGKILRRSLYRDTVEEVDPLDDILSNIGDLQSSVLDRLVNLSLDQNITIDESIVAKKLEAATEAIKTIATLAKNIDTDDLSNPNALEEKSKALEVATSILEDKVSAVNDRINEILNNENFSPAQLVEAVENIANEVNENVNKTAKAIIVSGGVEGISKKIQASTTNLDANETLDASSFATSFFNDQLIEKNAEFYDKVSPIVQTSNESNSDEVLSQALLSTFSEGNQTTDPEELINKIQDNAVAIEKEALGEDEDAKLKLEKKIAAKKLIKQDEINEALGEAKTAIQESQNTQKLANELAKSVAIKDKEASKAEALEVAEAKQEFESVKLEYLKTIANIESLKTKLQEAKDADNDSLLLEIKADLDEEIAKQELLEAKKNEKELALKKIQNQQKKDVQEKALESMNDVISSSPELQSYASELNNVVSSSKDELANELESISQSEQENNATLNSAKASLENVKETSKKIKQVVLLLDSNEVDEDAISFLVDQKDKALQEADEIKEDSIEQSALKAAREDAKEERERVLVLETSEKEIEKQNAEELFEQKVEALALLIENNVSIDEDNQILNSAKDAFSNSKTISDEYENVKSDALTLANNAANNAALEAELLTEDFENLILDVDLNNIKSDLTLPLSGLINSSKIEWQSNNPSIISNEGNVSRPLFTEGDTDVVLTATVFRGTKLKTKKFNLKVIKQAQSALEAVENDYDELTFNTIKNKNLNQNAIVSNLILPTQTANGSSIVWESSHTNISSDGEVSRSEYAQNNGNDKNVSLKAVIVKDDIIKTKEFTLIVKQLDQTDISKVNADKLKLDVDEYIDNKERDAGYTFQGKNGSTITWSAGEYIDEQGFVIKRPGFKETDIKLNVTATLTYGSASDTKEFVITLSKKEPTDLEVVNEVKSTLFLPINTNVIKSSLYLPLYGFYNSDIAWGISSSYEDIGDNANIEKNTLLITRPGSGFKTFTLEANISKGEEFVLKSFELTIPEAPKIPEVVVAMDKASLKLNIDKEAVIDSFTLLAANTTGSVITWSSSNNDYLLISGNEAVVTRPDFSSGDQSVKLTALISYTDEETKQSATDAKVFDLVILKKDNTYPIGSELQVNLSEDSSFNGQLVGSDIETSVEELTYFVDTKPLNGSVTLESNGTFVYTPKADYFGSDSFSYKVYDGQLYSRSENVYLNIENINDAPVAYDLNISLNVNKIDENTTARGKLQAMDIDSENIDFVVVSKPEASSAVISSDGFLTFIANENSSITKQYQITYQVSDGDELSNIATVSIDLNVDAQVPFAFEKFVSTNEDTEINGTLQGSDPNEDEIRFILKSSAKNGNVVLDEDGSFTYTPNEDFFGSDSFIFNVIDEGGLSSSDTSVYITVNAINDAPVFGDINVTIDEDTVYKKVLTAEDIDSESLTFSKVSEPAHGSVNLSSNGLLEFIPAENNNTDTSFLVKVSDGELETVANINIEILPINDAPSAQNFSFIINEDTVLVDQLNGTDIDSINELEYFGVIKPTNGTISISANGEFTYTPNKDFFGKDYFTYVISDSESESLPERVDITVQSINDAPIVNDMNISLEEDGYISFYIDAIDSDSSDFNITLIGNDSNSTQILTEQNGSAILEEVTLVSGERGFKVTYTPKKDFFGTDRFRAFGDDGEAVSSEAEIVLEVVNVNDAPLAYEKKLEIVSGNSITSFVEATDIDNNISSLEFILAGESSLGTVQLEDNGSFIYTRTTFNNENFDSFKYKVFDGRYESDLAEVFIIFANNAPVASDYRFVIGDNEILQTKLSATDIEGDPLTFETNETAISLSSNGDLSFDGNSVGAGEFTYKYRVSDGDLYSEEKNINIKVVGVPVINTVNVSTNEDSSLEYTFTTNDIIDSDTILADMRFVLLTNTVNGTLVFNDSGSFVYTPKANFNGTDSFEFFVTDGFKESNIAKVNITVNAQNDQPAAYNLQVVLQEDTNITVELPVMDIDGDSLNITLHDMSPVSDDGVERLYVREGSGYLKLTKQQDEAGAYRYLMEVIPLPNFTGTGTVTYSVDDGEAASGIQTITIEVLGTNDAPVAQEIYKTIKEDNTLEFDLNTHVSDIDGDSLNLSLVTLAKNGTVKLETGGIIRYIPNKNFYGTDSFYYQVSDKELVVNSKVTVLVESVNDAPVAKDGYIDLNKNLFVEGTVEFSDIDSFELNVTLLTDVTNGELLLNNDGTFKYIPQNEYHGKDSFTFIVTDEGGLSDEGNISITVNDVRDNVIAYSKNLSTKENESVSFELNATDVDGDDISFEISYSEIKNGKLQIEQNGTFTYIPNEDFNGYEIFSFIATDGTYRSNTATVSIFVENVEYIFANESEHHTYQDRSFEAKLNGYNEEGNISSYTITKAPQNGEITSFDPKEGIFVYTPANDFNGEDSFSFIVSDGMSESREASVSISVLSEPWTFDKITSLVEDQNLSLVLGDGNLTYSFSDGNTTKAIDGVSLSIDGNILNILQTGDSFSIPLNEVYVKAYNNLYDISTNPVSISDNDIDTSNWWVEENRSEAVKYVLSDEVSSFKLYVDENFEISGDIFERNGEFNDTPGKAIYIVDKVYKDKILAAISLSSDFDGVSVENNQTVHRDKIAVEINNGEIKVFDFSKISPISEDSNIYNLEY